MRPEQVLANSDVLGCFSSVNFLGLVCDEAVLRARVAGRRGREATIATLERLIGINELLKEDASQIPNMRLINTDRPVGQVEAEVRRWIEAALDK